MEIGNRFNVHSVCQVKEEIVFKVSCKVESLRGNININIRSYARAGITSQVQEESAHFTK